MKRQATRHIPALVGTNLRLARKARGLTQHELAQLVGTQGPFVSRWELGIHRPNDRMLAALGEVLERDLAWFYTEHNGNEPVAA